MSLSDLLIHTVTIEEIQYVRDPDLGFDVETWIPVGTMSARVQPSSAREVSEFQRRGWNADFAIQFDSDPGMTTSKRRIVFNGNAYEFRGVINWQEMDFHWTVACELKKPQDSPPSNGNS